MNRVRGIISKYKKMDTRAKAGVWFVVCSFLQKAIAFITVPIFTRIMTSEEYGTTNLFNTWSTILVIFATLNLSGGVYNRGLLEFDEKRYTSSVQGLATTCSLLVTIIVIIFHDFLSEISGLSTPILYLTCAYFLAVAGMNLWTVKQRFFYKYKALVGVTLLNVVVSTVFGLAAVLLSEGNKGEEKVIWSTIGLIIVALPFYFYNFRKGKKFFDRKMWKFSLAFNLPLLPHYLSNLILHQSDRIMINWFKGVSDVAFYSVAYSVASIANVFTEALNQTLTPWRYRNMKMKKYEAINRVSISMLICVALLVVAINLLAPEIIYIFGGESYSEAVWVIPPVVFSVFFMFMYGMFSNVEFYFLKTKFMMVASMISAVLNIVLNYLFIGQYGYIACAYTTLFCYIIYTFCHYIYMRHICKKEIGRSNIFDIKTIIIITIFTGILTLASTFLYNYCVIRYCFIAIMVLVVIIKRKDLISLLRLK